MWIRGLPMYLLIHTYFSQIYECFKGLQPLINILTAPTTTITKKYIIYTSYIKFLFVNKRRQLL